MSYLDERRDHINKGRPTKQKKVYQIPKKSAKKLKREAEQKVALGEDETMKEKWFKARRKEMVGICQCGCARKSSKLDDANFRSSCCHIFPQRLFESVQFHGLNFVERNFWEGCHSNMDNRSMDLWVNFADWEDIKERFHQLVPLLTDEERKTKFYSHLEKLVYAN
jgi:hypothetical protein